MSLRQRGLRVTPQRLLIVSALRHTGGHRSAQEILAEVRRGYGEFDASTAYRTLELLTQRRLATVMYTATGQALHEWGRGTPHYHLVCSRCGESREIDDDLAGCLTARLLATQGFTATPQHLVLPGICGGCAKRGGGARHDQAEAGGTQVTRRQADG